MPQGWHKASSTHWRPINIGRHGTTAPPQKKISTVTWRMGFVHPCFKYKFYITGTFSLLSQKYSGQRERFSFIIWRKQGLLSCAIACLQLWHSAFTLCSTSEAEMLVQQRFAVLKETERRTTVTSPTLTTKPYFTNLPIFSLLTFNFLYQILIHMQAYQGWQIIIFHTHLNGFTYL